MTTPQPNNQLPEEVRAEIREAVFCTAYWPPGMSIDDFKAPVERITDEVCKRLAPFHYLTPRPPAGITTERDVRSNAYVQPPAPVDAKWAANAARDIAEIDGICIGGDYHDRTAKCVNVDKLTAIILRHAPAADELARLKNSIDNLNARLSYSEQVLADERSELVRLRGERAKMFARVERGEFSEDCPFCLAKTQSPGVPNPMCHLCDIESQLSTLRQERDALLSERDNWRVSSVCRELVKERDELAKLLGEAKTLIVALKDSDSTDDPEPLITAFEALLTRIRAALDSARAKDKPWSSFASTVPDKLAFPEDAKEGRK